SLAASAFLHLVFFGGQDWSQGAQPPDVAGSLIFSIPFVALFVASFAFLPSLVVIIFAEILHRRDWPTYAIGGALVGLAVAAFFAQASGQAADSSITDPFSAGAIIGGGIVGGFVYWLV